MSLYTVLQPNKYITILVQWLEYCTTDLQVVCSNPAFVGFIFPCILDVICAEVNNLI